MVNGMGLEWRFNAKAIYTEFSLLPIAFITSKTQLGETGA